MKIKVSNVNTPNWKDVNVKSHIPAELEKLSELAHNIWWAWNYEATELFRDLDPALWKEVGQNPVLLLERMSYAKLEALANDKVILRRMDDVYSKFRTYMDVKPDSKRPSVAYFSMEYGLSHVLKIYSGGLGVLAEKAFVEVVVTGRNRSMYSIERRSTYQLDSLVVSQTFGHVVTDALYVD